MSLIHWWPLNGDYHDQGVKNPINFNGGNFIEGKLGQCLDFVQGAHTYTFSIPDLINKKQISISFWVKINSIIENDWHDIVGFYDNAASWNKTGLCRVELYNKCTSMSLFSDAIGAGATGDASPGATGVSFGDIEPYHWYHVTFSIDGINGIVKTYLSGQIKTEKKNLNKTWFVNGSRFQFGESAAMSFNDVRIYDHILSQKEVHEVSKGLFAHYTLSSPLIESTVNLISNNNFNNWSSYGFGSLGRGTEETEIFPALSGQVYKITSSDTTTSKKNTEWARWVNTNLSLNKYVTFSIYVKGSSSSFGCNAFAHIYNSDGTNTISRSGESVKLSDKWQRVEYTMIWPYDTTSASSSIYVVAQIPGGASYYISNPQVEFVNHATLYTSTSRVGVCTDGSGFGNTLNNGPHTISLSNNTPLYDKSIIFNNDFQQHLSCPAFKFIKQNMTMSCWFKCNGDVQHSYQFIVSQGRDCGNAGISIQLNQGGTICYCRYKTLNMTNYTTCSFGGIELNKWYHAVVTYNGAQIKVYLNGVLKSAVNVTGDLDWVQCDDRFVIGKMAFGYNNTGSYFAFNGNVSDVRMYATALSDADIKQMYESKASIDKNGNVYIGSIKEEGENQIFKTTYQMSNARYKEAGRMDEYSPIETFKSRHSNGIYLYNQSQQYCEITNDGVHFFCKPNLKYKNPDGSYNSVMYGGLAIQPLDVDINTIKKGHTYIFTWRLRGKYSRNMFCSWTHNMGWGGGGLDPTPSDVEHNMPSGSFTGERMCYYKFTVSDDIWKICTNDYSSFKKGQSYPSYCQFTIQHSYGDTGACGTDAYVDQFQMFDITNTVNKNPSITINEILNALSFSETPKKQLSGEMSDMMIKTLPDNTVWGRIFWHNNDFGTQLFSNQEEALNVQSDYKYSRLYLLNKGYFTNSGKYEFLLEYPGEERVKYNRWKQSSNPCNSTAVTGYEPIHIDWSGQQWGGLLKGSDDLTFLKGSTGGYWYYAIGAYQKYKTGIPDYNDATDNIIQLWVRIDNNLDYKNKNKQEVKFYKNGICYANEFIEK